jgi:alkylation response protein AidB-like acyl-CoA dehydrogenase
MQQAATLPAQYQSAQMLEQYLGDPSDAGRPFSFARAVELDEREEYPEEPCRLLDEWSFADYYVPKEYGGKLGSYEELLALVRVIARRDLTVAVAHVKTYLGAVTVWLGGSEEQKRRLAQAIRDREQVALALTERAHGADILADELKAVGSESGSTLSGEKWLVNNATRSTTLTVFARTDDGGGARGFSILLVEKKRLAAESYAHLPRIKTHGLRGADISGIRFKEALLPSGAHVGAPGAGLELMLKGFQVTRSIVPALSLGAADTGLRATLSFALSRKLYGQTVFDLAHARRTLVDAFLALLTCECLSVATTRALHVVPQQMSLHSSVVKYYVPTTIEKTLGHLAVVLGARYYLREGHWCGIFQKLLRDNAIASLFDGSAPVNLHAIALQLSRSSMLNRKTGADSAASTNLETIFRLQSPLHALRPDALELTCRGRNDILQGLGATLSRLEGLKAVGDNGGGPVLGEIIALTSETLAECGRFFERLDELMARKSFSFDKSAESFEFSRRYCDLQAAATCVHMWAYNRDSLPGFFAAGEWLVLNLHRLLTSFNPARALQPAPYVENVARELVNLYRGNRSFSIIPLRLPAQPTEA